MHTRKSIYELVWSKPMIHAGKDLGVSGTGLKKICVRHEIPIPPQGWWQKLAAGHQLTKTKLKPTSDPNFEIVRFNVSRKHPKACVKPEANDLCENDRVPTARPQILPRWIERIERQLQRRKPDSKGLIRIKQKSLPRIAVSSASTVRLVLFLCGFEQTLNKLSWTLSPSDHGLVVKVDGEPVGFALEDRLDRSPHTPTAVELAERDYRKRMGFTFLSDTPWPKYDYHASSDLVFVVDGGVNDGLRRRWGDTKRGRIEGKLPSIIQSFKAHAAAQIQERERHAAWKREFEAKEEARRREDDIRRQNSAFANLCDDIANVLSDTQRLQTVIDHLSRSDEGTPAEMRLLQWCDRAIAEKKAKMSRGSLDDSIVSIERGDSHRHQIPPGLFRDS